MTTTPLQDAVTAIQARLTANVASLGAGLTVDKINWFGKGFARAPHPTDVFAVVDMEDFDTSPAAAGANAGDRIDGSAELTVFAPRGKKSTTILAVLDAARLLFPRGLTLPQGDTTLDFLTPAFVKVQLPEEEAKAYEAEAVAFPFIIFTT